MELYDDTDEFLWHDHAGTFQPVDPEISQRQFFELARWERELLRISEDALIYRIFYKNNPTAESSLIKLDPAQEEVFFLDREKSGYLPFFRQTGHKLKWLSTSRRSILKIFSKDN